LDVFAGEPKVAEALSRTRIGRFGGLHAHLGASTDQAAEAVAGR